MVDGRDDIVMGLYMFTGGLYRWIGVLAVTGTTCRILFGLNDSLAAVADYFLHVRCIGQNKQTSTIHMHEAVVSY